MKVVTHGGEAHPDEFLATAYLLAFDRRIKSIERVGVVDERIKKDPRVYVVDIGLEHDPERLCFDHHQKGAFPPNEPKIALSWVLIHTGSYDGAHLKLPWLGLLEELDNSGVEDGLSSEAMLSQISCPCTDHDLKVFSGCSVIKSKGSCGWLFQHMRSLGGYLRRKLDRTVETPTMAEEREKLLDKVAKVIDLGWVVVLDNTTVLPVDSPSSGVEAWCVKNSPQVSLIITKDRQPTGEHSIYRRECAPVQVDLYRLKGHHRIEFVKSTGNLAKTKIGCRFDEALEAIQSLK